MQKSRIGELFMITGIINLVHAIIVKLFLDDPDLGENFKNYNNTFYAHEIYIWIGILWIAFGILYFIIPRITMVFVNSKNLSRHFYFTLPFVMILMSIPVLEKYLPSDSYSQVFVAVITIIVGLSFILFIVGNLFLIVSIFSIVLSFIFGETGNSDRGD